jgi:hypothetical protein
MVAAARRSDALERHRHPVPQEGVGGWAHDRAFGVSALVFPSGLRHMIAGMFKINFSGCSGCRDGASGTHV